MAQCVAQKGFHQRPDSGGLIRGSLGTFRGGLCEAGLEEGRNAGRDGWVCQGIYQGLAQGVLQGGSRKRACSTQHI